MLIIELKKFIKSHKLGVSLAQIMLSFDYPPKAISTFLENWIEEGKLKKFELKACCTTKKDCSSCDLNMHTIYTWIKCSKNTPKQSPNTKH